MGTGEQARWTRARLGRGGPSLDLLTARFETHTYAPHAHDEYTVGVCTGGLETIGYRGGHVRTGPGGIIVLAPGETHTGGPAGADGYAYRALYAAPALLSDSFGDVGPPHFPDALIQDPELERAFRSAHAALDVVHPDPLEAESRLPWLLTALAQRHAGVRPVAPEVAGAPYIAARVRDRLAAELRSPPALSELAAELGLSRYQLLRAFRTAMGLPPYAWLAQYRVHRARRLLDADVPPAEVAALVGFADQAHLTRWFRRVLGVTPAAYRNSVQDDRR